jgi:hypothetical protein
MDLSCFNYQQPACAYYYSPFSIYNLGMVDQAHTNVGSDQVNHLYAHVFYEDVGKKGGNNVTSLIYNTLKLLNLLDA